MVQALKSFSEMVREAARNRVASCLFKTAGLQIAWLMLAFLGYSILGGDLDSRVDVHFLLTGCDEAPDPSSAGLRLDSFDFECSQADSDQNSRLCMFGAYLDSQDSATVVAAFSDEVRKRGCQVKEVSLTEHYRANLWLLSLSTLSASLLVYLSAWLRSSSFPFSSNSERWARVVAFSGFGAALAILMGLAGTMFVNANAQGGPPSFGGVGALSSLTASILLAPVAEEVLFRGVLLRIWIRRGLVLVGATVVSLAFAGLHIAANGGSPDLLLTAVAAFVLSLCACFAYRRSGLYAAIGLHVAYNSTLLVPIWITG